LAELHIAGPHQRRRDDFGGRALEHELRPHHFYHWTVGGAAETGNELGQQFLAQVVLERVVETQREHRNGA
jgi:hypothetical protein